MCKKAISKEILPEKKYFDNGRNWRARIGYVILAMEQTIEHDVFRLIPPGVGVHFSRLPMANAITVNTLKVAKNEIAKTTSLILPEIDLDVVVMACTSLSFVLGEEIVMEELLKGAPKSKVTTMVTGVIRALQTLKARRIVIATPYLDEINVVEAKYFQEHGFEVLNIRGLNITNDTDIVRVSPKFIREFARSLDHPDADAIFVSCGALRTIDIIDALEQEVGKPVVSSNQAMVWDTLRIAGIKDKIKGYGSLLQKY